MSAPHAAFAPDSGPFLLGTVAAYLAAAALLAHAQALEVQPAPAVPQATAAERCARISDANFLDCYAQGFAPAR